MVKRREVVKFLKENGFEEKGGTNHEKFYKGNKRTVVPRHREISDRLFEDIKKQAGLK